jgi:hypothetical protein
MATQSKNRGGKTTRRRSEHGRSGSRGGNGGTGNSGGNGARHGRATRNRNQESNKQSSESSAAENNGGMMHRGVNTLSDSVKSHPVPALVVGAGLGYLAARGLRRTMPATSRLSEGARGVLGSVGEGLSGAASTTKEALGTAGETIKEGAARAWQGAETGIVKAGSTLKKGASAVGQGAERAFETSREAVSDTWEKHPLMVCAAVLAAGAAAGLFLPRTAAEDQTLGK